MSSVLILRAVRQHDGYPAEVDGSGMVGFPSEGALDTFKPVPNWAVFVADVPARGTGAGSVAWVNEDHRNTSEASLVLNKCSQLPERPRVQFPPLVPSNPNPSAKPYGVAVAPAGMVRFTEFHSNQFGRLGPSTGLITATAVSGGPRHIAIASDGRVWLTERFSNTVGYVEPFNNEVREFLLTAGAGPEDITADPDGSVWFTRARAGNVAQLSANGVTAEVGKSGQG